MNQNPLVLTLDFGTQSVRTSLITKKGEIIYIAREAYDPIYLSSKKGYAEQNADFYWENLVKCLKKLGKDNKPVLKDIVAMTVTTFRDSAVLLDKDNKPLRPVVLWLDQRLARADEKLPAIHRFLFKLVGMKNTIDMNRTRTTAHWVKENEPEIWAKVEKYVNISTYINFKLTGELADCPGGMTGHYPLYYKKGVWYKEGAMKGRIFGIPNRMLPKLVKPGDVIGYLTDEVADMCGLPKGLKLIASGSDKGCETIGLGCLTPDIGAISYGTACSIEVSNRKYHEPEPFLPAYSAAVPNLYNMDVQIYRGYWMLRWFASEFASELEQEAKDKNVPLEEILDQWLNDVPVGSDGLILQPYWGPGLRRPLAKGAMIGFSNVHTRKHMYNDYVRAGSPLSDGGVSPSDILSILGPVKAQEYIVNEVQAVYRLQGVKINDKHFEIIVRQMMRKVEITFPGDTEFLSEEMVDKWRFMDVNDQIYGKLVVVDAGGSQKYEAGQIIGAREMRSENASLERQGQPLMVTRPTQPATARLILQGITRAALKTDSFISAASFQETTKVLSEAAIRGRVDHLEGLKENVICGHLIPAGTGLKNYQDIIVGRKDELNQELNEL